MPQSTRRLSCKQRSATNSMTAAGCLDAVHAALCQPAINALCPDLCQQPCLPWSQHSAVQMTDRAGEWPGGQIVRPGNQGSLPLERYDLDSSSNHSPLSFTRLSVLDVPESAAKCYTDRGPRRVVPSPPALYRKALDQNRKIS